jgi:hypothetical protein
MKKFTLSMLPLAAYSSRAKSQFIKPKLIAYIKRSGLSWRIALLTNSFSVI